MLDKTFSEGQQQVGHLLIFFGGPSSDLVLFSSLYRVLIERETLLTTFQIGLQLPVLATVPVEIVYAMKWLHVHKYHCTCNSSSTCEHLLDVWNLFYENGCRCRKICVSWIYCRIKNYRDKKKKKLWVSCVDILQFENDYTFVDNHLNKTISYLMISRGNNSILSLS